MPHTPPSLVKSSAMRHRRDDRRGELGAEQRPRSRAEERRIAAGLHGDEGRARIVARRRDHRRAGKRAH